MNREERRFYEARAAVAIGTALMGIAIVISFQVETTDLNMGIVVGMVLVSIPLIFAGGLVMSLYNGGGDD